MPAKNNKKPFNIKQKYRPNHNNRLGVKAKMNNLSIMRISFFAIKT